MARYGLGRCIRSHLARTTGCASSRPLRSTSFGTGPWPTTAVRRMFWTARYSRCRLLAVADPAALQAAADRLSPDIVRRRLDYWTLILGPKFSKKERAQLNLSRLAHANGVIKITVDCNDSISYGASPSRTARQNDLGGLRGRASQARSLSRPLRRIPYRGRFDGFHALPASVSKTCLVRFDNNKYSVSASAVGRPVEIHAYADRVVIRQDGRIVAEHPRRYGRGETSAPATARTCCR